MEALLFPHSARGDGAGGKGGSGVGVGGEDTARWSNATNAGFNRESGVSSGGSGGAAALAAAAAAGAGTLLSPGGACEVAARKRHNSGSEGVASRAHLPAARFYGALLARKPALQCRIVRILLQVMRSAGGGGGGVKGLHTPRTHAPDPHPTRTLARAWRSLQAPLLRSLHPPSTKLSYVVRNSQIVIYSLCRRFSLLLFRITLALTTPFRRRAVGPLGLATTTFSLLEGSSVLEVHG